MICTAASSIWVQIMARYSYHFRTIYLIICSRHQSHSFLSEPGTFILAAVIKLYLAKQFSFLSIYSRCALLAVMSLKQFHSEQTGDESTITFTWNVNYISHLKLIGNHFFILHLLFSRHKHKLRAFLFAFCAIRCGTYTLTSIAKYLIKNDIHSILGTCSNFIEYTICTLCFRTLKYKNSM